MTQLVENKLMPPSHYRRFFEIKKPGGGAFVRSLRESGIERFDAVGFPTTRQEEWRLTNVAPIARLPFSAAERGDESAARKIVHRFSFETDAAAELVVVNGHFDADLSRLG